jgi:hypothetical protein
VTGRNLDQDYADTVWILDPHLDQPPRLRFGSAEDEDSGGGQPVVLGPNVAHLHPDHHGLPGRAGGLPRDLEQSWAEEEHHAGIIRRPELPVHGESEDVAIETAAAVKVARAEEDPAAENVHGTIAAPA